MVIRKYGRAAGPTQGPNVRYDTAERDSIVRELYDFLGEDKVLREIAGKTNDLPYGKKLLDRNEMNMDLEILDNAELYTGIQKIFRKHGVEIPSQHVVDKGEVIKVKKKLIKEQLNLNEDYKKI